VGTDSDRVGSTFAKPSSSSQCPANKGLHLPQIVPFLPYLFDHPVETAVDYFFEKVEQRLIESHGGVVPPAAIEEKRDL
jgi:hypothetical protein